MNGRILRVLRWGIDLAVLSLAFWLAAFARFEGEISAHILQRLLVSWPYVVWLQYSCLAAFSVQRFSWRYVGLPEARKILVACGLSSLVLLMVRLSVVGLAESGSPFMFLALPAGVIVADLPLTVLGILGVRVLRRVLTERRETHILHPQARPVRTMLVGAGEGGVAVARELRVRPSLGLTAVGFLDDDESKVGTVVHGILVLGTTARLAELCHRYEAEQVLVTIARVKGEEVRRIVRACEEASLPVKIIPALHEIVGGQINLSRIRDVAIEDLLRREPVQLQMSGIAAFLQGKTVVVTGAGGSIGAEICRQVARFSPSRLVLVERFESALFAVHRDLVAVEPTLDVWPEIADISDEQRMERLFAKLQTVDVVFHAAAHKHVPLMELNPGEAIKNNVLGTKRVADLSARHRVRHFVLISTDKAVNPTSIMGASKRVAELYIQGMQQQCDTRFVAVRFGNVLGSNGSVVPIFKAQIEAGGPVTVTHPEMTRYFMTIPEATQLVLQAASLGRGGEVFILDMGEPVRILDLAKDLIALSGLEAGKDIEIVFSGIRPGEKLFEELCTDDERAERTQHSKVFIGRVQRVPWDRLKAGIEQLQNLVEANDAAAIYDELRALIPEFSGQVTKARASVTEAASGEVIPLRRS